MGVQCLYIEGPQLLLWAGSRAASGKISIDGAFNRLNYCVLVTAFSLDLILRQKLIKCYMLSIDLYGAENMEFHTYSEKKEGLVKSSVRTAF
jgi:hypothetical protein